MKKFVSRPADERPWQASSPGSGPHPAPGRSQAAQAAPPPIEEAARERSRRRSGILAELDELEGRRL
jgi:hypothetical protein